MTSYVTDKRRENPAGADWHAITWDRLAAQYGPQRADAIMAGKDAQTQADVARWNNLGRRSAA